MAFEKILNIINNPWTSNIFIADPFINSSVLESILDRVKDSEKKICILTSYDDNLDPKTDELRFQNITALWENKYARKHNWNLKITYSQSSEKSSRDFHDRYFLYTADGKQKGFLLSNSLGSIGTNWSFTMAELDRDVIDELVLVHEELISRSLSTNDTLKS